MKDFQVSRVYLKASGWYASDNRNAFRGLLKVSKLGPASQIGNGLSCFQHSRLQHYYSHYLGALFWMSRCQCFSCAISLSRFLSLMSSLIVSIHCFFGLPLSSTWYLHPLHLSSHIILFRSHHVSIPSRPRLLYFS